MSIEDAINGILRRVDWTAEESLTFIDDGGTVRDYQSVRLPRGTVVTEAHFGADGTLRLRCHRGEERL
uniref:Uncharacterized protein n=1 Tax=viral metagenome TaxID=1070528 RepID=A0A6M3LKQ5_9ZZZZ